MPGPWGVPGADPTVTLLHQYQRPVKTVVHQGQTVEYIDVTIDDIRIANRLAHEVLGRTLDEVPPQARRLLGQLDVWVRGECERLGMVRGDFRFSRRDVRGVTGLSLTQSRLHLDRLVELEYLLVHRGMRGQNFEYELVYEGQGASGELFLMGLIDPDALGESVAPRVYDGKLAGSEGELAGGWRPHDGVKTPGWRVDSVVVHAAPDQSLRHKLAEIGENAVLDEGDKILSYLQVVAGGNGTAKAAGGPG